MVLFLWQGDFLFRMESPSNLWQTFRSRRLAETSIRHAGITLNLPSLSSHFSSCLFRFCRLSASPKRGWMVVHTDPDVATQTVKKPTGGNRTGVCQEIPFTWTFPQRMNGSQLSRDFAVSQFFSPPRHFESAFLPVCVFRDPSQEESRGFLRVSRVASGDKTRRVIHWKYEPIWCFEKEAEKGKLSIGSRLIGFFFLC